MRSIARTPQSKRGVPRAGKGTRRHVPANERRVFWAMVLTGFVISIPVFLDVALVILAPILYALSHKTGKSVLAFGCARPSPCLIGARKPRVERGESPEEKKGTHRRFR